VILACRNQVKGEAAQADIVRAGVPANRVEARSLDLASQSSVTEFADSFRAGHDRLDLLINNAGRASGGGSRSGTADGFEAHFGVNHLGHMALTLHLLPALVASPGSRVVTLTSGIHRVGRIRLDDPNYTTGGYRPNRAYAQSKLANILFSMELGRRLAASGHDAMSLAADPGYARTELITRDSSRGARVLAGLLIITSQSAGGGARPALRAATDPRAASGQLYAPRWSTRGAPVIAKPSRHATDPRLAAQLWDLSLSLLSLDNPAALAR
jgi:NAD(P)-dependent dehydrogenase (short-subunit alcohol dehydrogenase family)